MTTPRPWRAEYDPESETAMPYLLIGPKGVYGHPEEDYPVGACYRAEDRDFVLEVVNDSGVLIKRLERADARLAELTYSVDAPRTMSLHYDECPFKPFSEMSTDAGGDAPDCTCPGLHQAAYWKGQWMLERGHRQLDVATLETRARAVIETAFAYDYYNRKMEAQAALIRQLADALEVYVLREHRNEHADQLSRCIACSLARALLATARTT